MTRFQKYEEPSVTQGDTYKPIDHVGATLIVKVKEHKTGIVTENSPDGGPGVIVDLVDLDNSLVYRDVLWMGGAMVDGLKQYVGGMIVVEIESRKSKSGRKYPAPIGVSDSVLKAADAYFEKNGDPFAVKLSTVKDDDKPPF